MVTAPAVWSTAATVIVRALTEFTLRYREFYEEMYRVAPLLMRTFTKLAGPIVVGVFNWMFIDIGWLAETEIRFVKVTFNVVWLIVTPLKGWVIPLAMSKLAGVERLETPIGNSIVYKLFAGIAIVLVKDIVRVTVE